MKRLVKIFLFILGTATLLFAAIIIYKTRFVFDVSRLSPTIVSNVIQSHSVEDLQETIQSTDLPISIAGGRYSQGGQIAYPGGLVIDTLDLNNIVDLNEDAKTITVQPGIRWRDIQQYIDPYDLSVKVMQSYNDFTVGGSLSVNVHGRDTFGSIIKTVISLKILLADGSIQTVSREHNPELFFAAIGGYGLLGTIIEATLQLTDNQKIERIAKTMPLEEYPQYFFSEIYNNKKIVFHNANIYPSEFVTVSAVTWIETEKEPTITSRLKKDSLHIKQKTEEHFLKRITPVKKIREKIETKELDHQVVEWRNYEMSYTVASLEPLLRFPTTSILQEYFVPVKKLLNFMDKFRSIVHEHGINILNVSIRHIKADTESILAYAPQESFALVCYIDVPRTISQKKERMWTQLFIDAALSVGGTFYLPYHLYATKEQFQKAYPRYQNFLDIKKEYDPQNKFINSLYEAYMA